VTKPKLIAIVGPTASGKTALSIKLAKALHGEIISADSRQVYKGLDIGTGKVTRKEMSGVPHYLLDVANPKKRFSADDFLKKGQRALSTIRANKRIPILVGGTGLYVDALVGRVAFPRVPPNQKLRERLERLTTKQLFIRLKKLDPRRAVTIESRNPRRLVRALEIAHALGKSPSLEEIVREQAYEILWLGLKPSDKKLQENIHSRLFERIRAGMIKEAEALHKQGLSYKRMEELGLEYRYLSLLLQKKITRNEFNLQLERAIRQYAKRQMRWFVRNPNIVWVKSYPQALKLAKKFIM
jgi:tRNA dimethylallyltransferase